MIEAGESLDQTKRLNNLTVLTFVFVPLSFVSGFFGMNVDVLADNSPVWIYFAIALPTAGIVFLVHHLFPKGFRLAWFRSRTHIERTRPFKFCSNYLVSMEWHRLK